MPTGSPETPGNPAIVAPSFVNWRFAESEVAVGAVEVQRLSAAGGGNSLFVRENTGRFRDSAARGEAGAAGSRFRREQERVKGGPRSRDR